MRRAIPVIAVTVGGLALVANFHTNPGGVPLVVGPSSTPTTAPAGPSSTTASAAERPGTPGHETTRSVSTTQPALPRATTPPPTSAPPTRSVDGPVITTNYGDVQVRLTLNGKRLADVQALQLPKDRSRSVRISQNAGPRLRSEALQAQSAHINLVSGATSTSKGYIDSLQGALDLAGP